jgi:hypothetical protein
MSQTGEFEQFSLIAGHFSLPSHAHIAGDRFSMTLLRDPIRTIFSTYTYWRATSEQNLATSVAKRLSFAEFVRYFEWSPALISNRFTHHFAGLDRELPRDHSGLALLAMAKHNLSAFDFIGICEEYERSARLLCRELGWQVPTPLPHENRSWSEQAIADIDAQTMQILRERNELDYTLYAYALALFHEREQASLSPCERPLDSRDATRQESNWLGQGIRHRPQRSGFLPFPTTSETGGQARVEAVSAAWLPDKQSQLLELAVRFRTKVHIPNLIFGVAILGPSGNNVWGTNTALERLDLRNEPDCICRAAFVLECSAPSGRYFVTVALHRPQNLIYHDHWLDRATSFEVTTQADCLDGEWFKLRQFWSTVD